MAEGIGGTWKKREVPKEGIGVLCTHFVAWRERETLRAEKENSSSRASGSGARIQAMQHLNPV